MSEQQAARAEHAAQLVAPRELELGGEVREDRERVDEVEALVRRTRAAAASAFRSKRRERQVRAAPVDRRRADVAAGDGAGEVAPPARDAAAAAAEVEHRVELGERHVRGDRVVRRRARCGGTSRRRPCRRRAPSAGAAAAAARRRQPARPGRSATTRSYSRKAGPMRPRRSRRRRTRRFTARQRYSVGSWTTRSVTALARAKARLDRLELYPRPVSLRRVRIWSSPWLFRLPWFRRFDGYAAARDDPAPLARAPRRRRPRHARALPRLADAAPPAADAALLSLARLRGNPYEREARGRRATRPGMPAGRLRPLTSSTVGARPSCDDWRRRTTLSRWPRRLHFPPDSSCRSSRGCRASARSTRSRSRSARRRSRSARSRRTRRSSRSSSRSACMDLTTLEGSDTPGQGRRALLEGDPARPERPEHPVRAPRSASTRTSCPTLRRAARAAPACKVAAVATGFPSGQYPTDAQGRRRAQRGRARRRRDRHGDRPRRVPLRPLREGLRRDRAGEGSRAATRT